MDPRNPALALAAADDAGPFSALAQRLLNLVLFVTILTSSIAFIEPAPHDGLMMVLLVTCVGARVGFDRKLIPLLLLLVLWLVGGLSSLLQVGDQTKAIQYAGTSIYLCIAAVMFACLFCDGNLVRLAILRRSYILAALIATAAGYIGFFHLVPGADIFLDNDRVSATFKDPNVYGPFLIFPIVWLLVSLLVRGIRLLDVASADDPLGRAPVELLARRLDPFRHLDGDRYRDRARGHARPAHARAHRRARPS